jgi:RHS repeat-associated protein
MPQGKNEELKASVFTKPAEKAAKQLTPKAAAASLGIASNRVPAPASIAELARALKNDVDLIYQFVHDNIEFYPMYGVQKGAFGTLVDGMGNPFDQSMLMVALLRQAGYVANHVFGQITLTPSELKNWLGTDDTNSSPASDLLTSAGIPHTVNMTGATWDSITLNHMWVKCNIGGTDYVFDPSLKTYTYQSGISVESIMSYSQSTFLSNAQSGSTVTSTSVQNLNRTNIRSDMSTYANNLLTNIKTNNPDATLDEVIGGRKIVAASSTPLRNTTHPKQTGSPVVWTSIPNAYRTTVRIKFPNTTWTGNNDLLLYSDDIYHKRLTLRYYSNTNRTELRLDDVALITGPNNTFGGALITYTVTNNAIAGSAETRTADFGFAFNGIFCFTFSFGPCSKEAANYHKFLQKEMVQPTGSTIDYRFVAESCNIQFFTYMALLSQNTDILGRLRKCAPVHMHHGGYIGFLESGLYYYYSMNLGETLNFSDLDASVSFEAACRDAFTVLVNGTEGMTVRQQLKSSYVGVNSVMEAAMVEGSTIYDVNSSTWATISPNFFAWDTNQLNVLKTTWVDNGARAFVAANGSILVGARHGNGFWAALPGAEHWAAIALGYKGAFPSDPADPNGGGGPGGSNPDGGGEGSDEPIDLFTGAYMYDKTDLHVGSSKFPYGLNFTRSYTSSKNDKKGTLGYGWTHNYAISAKSHENAFLTLGDAPAIFAVPNIAGMLVLSDLVANPTTDTLVKLVCAAMVERWKSDAVGINGVSVNIGNDEDLLLKLVDGTYAPIDGRGSSVTINGSGNYVYTTKFGETATFNANGDIVTWAMPYGVTITFEYQNNLLQRVSNGMGRAMTFRYNASGYLTEVFDGAGRDIGFEFDATGNLTKFRNTQEAITEYTYDHASRLEKIFRPENPTNAIVTNAYDSLGRIMTQTDANSNQWTYLFAGYRSEEENPLGNSMIYFNDFNGRALKIIDQLGNETLQEFDGFKRRTKITMPEGNSVATEYDPKGNVLKLTKVAKGGSGLSDIENTFTYNTTWNKVATEVDGNGNTTTYTYDGTTSNLLTIQRPVINSVTPTITHTYNARGQLLTKTDETSIVTKWIYDTATEALLSIVYDFGSSPHLNLTTAFTFDVVGNVTSVTDARNNTFKQKFDSERRMLQSAMAEPFEFITQYTYNLNGMLTSRRNQAPGMPVWQQTTYAYELDGKPHNVVDTLGRVTKYGYDQLRRLETETDSEDRVTTLAYDARSQVSTVTSPDGDVAQERTYWENGKLHEITDANGNTTVYTYDGFDRLHRATFANSKYEENTSYDDNDNLLVFKTRNGDTITNTFDVHNRLVTRTPQGMPTVTHSYDLAGRLTGISTPTVSGDPGSGSFVNSFDTAGRFYREQYPDGKQVTFQLDANGNITRMTYPDGYYVERFYDELNRLTAIKLNGSTTEEVSITYDALSRRATMTFANGTSTEYEFAVNNDLTGLSHSFVGSSLDADYQFNEAHQLMSQFVSDEQFMWHPPSAVTTTYGAANNINQYPTVDADTYTYNNNGCLTADGVWTFGYDVQNRLTSAAKSGVSASYLYDPLNRQSQKDVGGTKTRFIYNGAQRIAEYNGTSGSLITRFVYAKGLDEPVVEVTSAGIKSYFHRDRQGSIIAKTDDTGAVTQRNEYGPFGESAALSGISFGYTGQRYDAESGLYFYKTRYYSPVIGRFLQPDTIGYGDGLNMYAYVNNQPMDSVDLLGTGGDEEPRVYTGSAGGSPAGLKMLDASDINGDTEPYVPYLPWAFGRADAAADFDYGSSGVGFGVGLSNGPGLRTLSFAGISTPSFGVSRAPSGVGRFGLAASSTANLGAAASQPARHGISMLGSLGAPANVGVSVQRSGAVQGSGFGRIAGPGMASQVASPAATANGFGIGLLPSLGRSASPSNDVVGPTQQVVPGFSLRG